MLYLATIDLHEPEVGHAGGGPLLLLQHGLLHLRELGARVKKGQLWSHQVSLYVTNTGVGGATFTGGDWITLVNGCILMR